MTGLELAILVYGCGVLLICTVVTAVYFVIRNDGDEEWDWRDSAHLAIAALLWPVIVVSGVLL